MTAVRRGLFFLVALGVLLGFEAAERRASGRQRLHWGSEDLIQTVALADLAAEPARSLVYLHVQPPGLEMARLLLLEAWPGAGDPLLRVDRGLSVLWAGAYAGLLLLVFQWLRAVVPLGVALAVTGVVALHPAALLFATVPDTTLLTALLVTWSSFELWRVSPSSGSAPRLAAAFLALFLVRSIYQWPALVVFAAAIALRGGGRRRVAVFLAVAVPVVAAYAFKQQVLLGTTATTSFTGYNCLRSIGVKPYGFERGEVLAAAAEASGLPDPRSARVLSTVLKASGVQNFNHVDYLAANRVLLDACRVEYGRRSWRQLGAVYAQNAGLYLWPSSRYANAQPVLARVPWRRPFDWALSGARWLGLLAAACSIWLAGALRRTGSDPRSAARAIGSGIGLALPVLMVVAASVLLERGENMRFRFFVEPVALVFASAQAATLGGWLRRAPAAPAEPSPAVPGGSRRG